MLEDITASLFSQASHEIIYHYTNLSGLLGITDTKTLWASDIRCMNDAAELLHFATLIKQAIRKRLRTTTAHEPIMKAFMRWFDERLANGALLFACSFHEDGNLLSQWRGYSSVGQGVSIGFDALRIQRVASDQQFFLGRCIYDSQHQEALIEMILEAILAHAIHSKEDDGAYRALFATFERNLFRMAALFKHPSFQEEKEWRIMSDVFGESHHKQIEFRVGRTMLVPYTALHLDAIGFEHIFVGPTPNSETSLNTLNMYLNEKEMQPKQAISYCNIPYRVQ